MSEILEAAPVAVEEVVTEAEQVEVAPEGEGQVTDQPAEGEESPEDKDRKSRNERRKEAKARMEAQLRDAETAKQAAERRAAELKTAAELLPAPKQADFQTYEDYQAALSAYHVVRMTDAREAQRIAAEAKTHFDQAEQIRRAQDQTDAENWASHMEDARKRYPDFDQVALRGDIPVSPSLAKMIAQSDVAGELAYFIGKNPEIAGQVSNMTPVDMARAVGRLEAHLNAPKPKTVSTAPEPITPVRPKAAATVDPAKMTAAQFAEWRAKGGTFNL